MIASYHSICGNHSYIVRSTGVIASDHLRCGSHFYTLTENHMIQLKHNNHKTVPKTQVQPHGSIISDYDQS